jgi:putative endonuclease
MKSMFVYILKCSDETYYTGVTNNLIRRLREHQNSNKANSYTFPRRPVILVYQEEFNSSSAAIRREKQIKNWSRKKKEALIQGDYANLRKQGQPKLK